MQDQPTREQDLETLREYISDRFVDVPENRKDISKSENIRWLAWLARRMFEYNNSQFLIERMQPSWLPNRSWRWSYMLIVGLLTGFVGGVVMWLFLQLLRMSDPQLPAPISNCLANFLQVAQGRAEFLTLIFTNIFLGLIWKTTLSRIYIHESY